MSCPMPPPTLYTYHSLPYTHHPVLALTFCLNPFYTHIVRDTKVVPVCFWEICPSQFQRHSLITKTHGRAVAQLYNPIERTARSLTAGWALSEFQANLTYYMWLCFKQPPPEKNYPYFAVSIAITRMTGLWVSVLSSPAQGSWNTSVQGSVCRSQTLTSSSVLWCGYL